MSPVPFPAEPGKRFWLGSWERITNFANNWVNWNSGADPAQIRRVGNLVTMRGMVSSGTLDIVAAFTLPAEYRPTIDRRLAAACSDPSTAAHATVFVNADGTVYIVAAAGFNTWVDLTSVRYDVD